MSDTPAQGTPSITPAARVADDLTTIISAAERHGTLARLKSVAIYFDEIELRTIIHALRHVEAADRLASRCADESAEVEGDTFKHMRDQVDKARGDGTFSTARSPAEKEPQGYPGCQGGDNPHEKAGRSQPASAVLNYVANGGDELAKAKAELAHALGALDREMEQVATLGAHIEQLTAALKKISEQDSETWIGVAQRIASNALTSTEQRGE